MTRGSPSTLTVIARRVPTWSRQVLLLLVASASLVLLARELHSHLAIQRWLFFRYAHAASLALIWFGSTCAAGFGTLARLLPHLPLRQKFCFGAVLGLLEYYWLQVLGGLLGFYGAAWCLFVPFALGITGLWLARRSWRNLIRHRRKLRFTLGVGAHWQVPLAVLGVVCVALLYLGILTPRNAAFDSLWYHLGLGEGWAAAGGIERSPEGWYMSTLPDMAAMVYAWAFLVPWAQPFDIMMVAAHQEFLVFVATLFSIPVLVNALVPRAPRVSWVALFAFPSVFIYDASLHSGNDHIGAFFAVPTGLALLRLWRRFEVESALLLAAALAGALLTKYQAFSLALGPAMVASGLAVRSWYRTRTLLLPARVLGSLALVLLLLMAPFWLRNWLWYGDPLYPALHRYLTLRPFHEDAERYMDLMWRVNVWRPKGTFLEQIGDTLREGLTFAFESHAHKRFHGDWPYVGALFTLSLLWLPFLRGARRIWMLAIVTQLGVFAWYYLSHVERYLQLLLPWMAAVAAATLVLVWRSGGVGRVPVAFVVALQVVWGGDALFLKSHAMLGELPIVAAARLLGSGFANKPELLANPMGGLQPIGDSLPDGAVLLLHDHNGRLGLRHRVVVDKPRYQGLIRYGAMTHGEVLGLYRRLGISHVVWRKSSDEYATLGADLLFFELADNLVEEPARFGSFYAGALSIPRPEPPPESAVVYAGCGRTYERGVYNRLALNVIEDGTQVRVRAPVPLPTDEAELRDVLANARYLVTGERCPPLPVGSTRGYREVAQRHGEKLWVRPW